MQMCCRGRGNWNQASGDQDYCDVEINNWEIFRDVHVFRISREWEIKSPSAANNQSYHHAIEIAKLWLRSLISIKKKLVIC